MKNNFLLPIAFFSFGTSITHSEIAQNKPSRPNIIVILADDLGYGDVSAYGPYGIQTPNIDQLAKNGLRFTNAHATAATSTPSRYSLLTGSYPWRNQEAKILPGDAPLIIQPNSQTLPSVLRKAGYTTGVVGKWHLGIGNGNINWNEEVKPGPEAIGFDYHYIFAATNDRVPCVYIEQNHVVNLEQSDPIGVNYQTNFSGEPNGADNPELLKVFPSHGHANSIVNGVSRIGFMKGGKAARWKDEEMADLFLSKALQFINDNQNKPFFLYYALHQPHVPRIPNPRFAGKSELGPRGDVILEANWCVGELVNYLNKLGLIKNTLILFTSDNGPVLDDGYKDDAVEKNGNHKPAGPFRSGKYSLYNGGTQIPFIIQWLGTIKPGVSDALVSHLDFLASFAKLTGIPLTGITDSQDELPALLGRSKQGRQNIVLEASGNLAFLENNYFLIPPYKNDTSYPNESGLSDAYQLFHVSSDVGEQQNIATENPQKTKELKDKLEQISGRK